MSSPNDDTPPVKRSERRPVKAWLPERGPVREEYLEEMCKFVDFCQSRKPPVSVPRTIQLLLAAYAKNPSIIKE